MREYSHELSMEPKVVLLTVTVKHNGREGTFSIKQGKEALTQLTKACASTFGLKENKIKLFVEEDGSKITGAGMSLFLVLYSH